MQDAERAEILAAMKNDDISIIVDVIQKKQLDEKGYGDDNSTLLHEAVKEGQLKFAGYLVESGADVNEINNNGETPFHVAAKFGKTEMAAMLTEKRGRDMVNAVCQNDTKQTALHLACANGHTKFVALLLDEFEAEPLAGADLFERTNVTAIHLAVHLPKLKTLAYLSSWKEAELLSAVDSKGDDPFYLAIRLPQPTALPVLVKKGGIDIEVANPDTGRNALLEAVDCNFPEVMEVLVEELGANVNAVTKNGGLSGLHISAKKNQADTLRALLSWKSNVEIQEAEEGNTPLHLAAKMQCLEAAKILFYEGKASIEAGNNKGRTPLALIAAEHGDERTTRFFMENLNSSVNTKSSPEDYDGATPLHLACIATNFDCAKAIISSSKKQAFKAENNSGETVLHYFINKQSEKLVKFLLKHGADVDQMCTNSAGRAPLHIASVRDDISLAKILLHYKANWKLQSSAPEDSQLTPITLAAKHGSRRVFRELFETRIADVAKHGVDGDVETKILTGMLQDKTGAVDIEAANPSTGRNAFLEAVNNNLPEVMKVLVNELGANVNAVTESGGLSGLHISVKNNHAEALRSLLSLKANVDIQEAKDGNTPLHLAAKMQRLALAQILFYEGKASIEARNKKGRTPFALIAAEHGDERTARFFIERFNASVNAKSSLEDYDGATPLHLACIKKNLDCAKTIISSSKKQALLAENNSGETVLHYFINNQSEKLVKFLLKHGADVNQMCTNSAGRAPLHITSVRDDISLAKILLHYKANTKLQSATPGDSQFTPIILAAQFGSHRVFRVLLDTRIAEVTKHDVDGEVEIKILTEMLQDAIALGDKSEVVAFLIPLLKTSNVANLAGFLGRTPLHIACYSNRFETVKRFVENGGKINVKSDAKDYRRTPLHMAAMIGSDDIVEALVQAGCKMNVTDSNKNSAIHLAALCGRLKVVEKLITLGDNVGQRGCNGKTPLHQACIWTGEQTDESIPGAPVIRPYQLGDDKMAELARKLPEIAVREPKTGSNTIEGRKLVPLSDTAYDDKLAIVKLLLQESPALASVNDDNGNRPIHHAASTGHTAILRFYVQWRRETFLEARGHMGRTPLQFAVLNGQFDTVRYLLGEANANPNTKSNAAEDCQRTALHLLILEGAVTKIILAMIELLKSFGAKLDSCDANGDRPLHYAVEACDRDSDWLDVVKLLIDSGANMEAIGNYDHTPLERAIASKSDNVESLDILLQLGAKIEDGDRAISIANLSGNIKISDYLKKHMAITKQL